MSQSTICPKETPFFIVGNPRSGTTLLTFILSSHPRIHIPGETGFLPRLTKYVPGQLSREQVSRIIQTIGRLNYAWDGLVEDENNFYNSLPAKNLLCVLDDLYHRRIKGFNAARWGDKTPSYVRFIPQIASIFPTAQFIHIIRDGRDSTLSAQQKWGKRYRYMDNYYLLKNWAENVLAGSRAGQEIGPARYLEVRYERLVNEPRDTIEMVCDFLEETFHPDMLEHTKLAREVVTPTGHIEVVNKINTRSVGRWAREMTAFDKKTANKIIGPTLQSYGYPLAEVEQLSFKESLRLFYLGSRYQAVKRLRNILLKFGMLQLNRGKRRKAGNNRLQ